MTTDEAPDAGPADSGDGAAALAAAPPAAADVMPEDVRRRVFSGLCWVLLDLGATAQRNEEAA